MSKSHIGKKDSEETKQKKSQSAKGRIKSAEWRKNISDSHPTKTTLVNILTGGLCPSQGQISIGDFTYAYLDQEYNLVHKNSAYRDW